MSKIVEGMAKCPECGNQYHVSLFRSLWGEHPEKRALVFNNLANVIKCSNCGYTERAAISFLYVDMVKQFAVWYDPVNDPDIDKEKPQYEQMFGKANFYVTAPKIRTWENFKETILQFERGELKAKPIDSRKSETMTRGFIEHINKENNKSKSGGCLTCLAFALMVTVGIALCFI